MTDDLIVRLVVVGSLIIGIPFGLMITAQIEKWIGHRRGLRAWRKAWARPHPRA